MAGDFKFVGDGFRPVLVEAMHAHAEGFGAACDLLTDAPEADDPNALAQNFAAGDAVPTAGACAVDGEREILRHGENEQEGVLGDGVVVDAGGEEDGDFKLLGRRDVDFIEADSVFGDDFQAGEGFLDDRAGDCVVAAKKCVEVAGEFEHACFGERAALADDVPALSCHECVVGTGGVLVTAGRE